MDKDYRVKIIYKKKIVVNRNTNIKGIKILHTHRD